MEMWGTVPEKKTENRYLKANNDLNNNNIEENYWSVEYNGFEKLIEIFIQKNCNTCAIVGALHSDNGLLFILLLKSFCALGWFPTKI